MRKRSCPSIWTQKQHIQKNKSQNWLKGMYVCMYVYIYIYTANPFVDRKTTVSCKTCAFTQSMEQWLAGVVISTISLCTYTWDQGNHPWMKKICDFLCHFTIPYQPSSRFYSGKWLCKCRQVSALYIFPRRQRVWLKIGYRHIETQHDVCQTRQRVWLNMGHLKISWLIDIHLCLTCFSIAEYLGFITIFGLFGQTQNNFSVVPLQGSSLHTPN